MQNKQKILIFGGTVFIGKTFLDYLKTTSSAYEIVCLNRGTVYWDDAVKKDHPQIKHVFCDRKQPESVKETLIELNKKYGITPQNRWKAVIDFSAYYQSYLTPTTVLSGLIEKYILISTDSVYNNSLSRVVPPIKEDSLDIIKECELIQQENNVKDHYGYNKLKCEVYLNKQKPYEFICMRLPDVLGEFDQFESSQRVWCTVSWLINSEKYPVVLTKAMKEKKLSFVDSLDVAKMVHHFIESKIPPHNAYNFACDQTPTLFEFYELITSNLKQEIKYSQGKSENLLHFFPSVESGVIDCSRAKSQVGWAPTPLKQTVSRFVDFYLKKASHFPKEKDMMAAEFLSFQKKLTK